ncbi:hypothetical protein [Halosolutus gelatinilyticus]|uniref:hypothetical protein n=1 Tax=Halosolutus gelatinilyticus TaxID=2931975 RepID=UPI001FF282D8|nr:hypothetical protein [Halosolutus gelatinilyticus]
MNRRRFLRAAGSGFAVAGTGLAGCLSSFGGSLSSDDVPPPREAEVFEDVSINDGTMKIELDADPRVESRIDAVDQAPIVGLLVPVGTARAGSRSSSGSGSSGATGRGTGGYSSAPRGRHNWAIYGGHSNGSWRDDHDDEYDWYSAAIATLGVAYVGSNTAYRRRSPGPGPVNWDETWSDPDPGTTFEVDLATLSSGPRADADAGSEPVGNESDAESVPADETESAPEAKEGWYRVGTRLESPDGAVDFEWQAADFKLDRGATGDLSADEVWHVRPRL